jgi:threonylcarbamoyladenosine tRNA methylthiotransferase MtaB
VVGGDRGCDASLDLPPALHFGDRSRAFLKVQEGCRLACSYCVIPEVRGPSRSVRVDRVVAAARSLFEAGYREIVLTGVNVGDYGRDLDPRSSLVALLRRLLTACGPNRIRLNSLEPRTVTDEIIELMAREPRLAPHLQVPLQSGSDEILRRMRRNYGVDTYLDRLNRIRAAVPHAGLGADVIVGFPGEDDGRFRQTYELIASSPLNYLHVFPWSPRPGTAAADYPERVAPERVKERSRALRALGEQRSLRFRKGFVGRTLDAVVLGPRRSDGLLRALTGNFIEVALDPRSAARGDFVRARLLRATPDETTAVVTGVPLS